MRVSYFTEQWTSVFWIKYTNITVGENLDWNLWLLKLTLAELDVWTLIIHKCWRLNSKVQVSSILFSVNIWIWGWRLVKPRIKQIGLFFTWQERSDHKKTQKRTKGWKQNGESKQEYYLFLLNCAYIIMQIQWQFKAYYTTKVLMYGKMYLHCLRIQLLNWSPEYRNSTTLHLFSFHCVMKSSYVILCFVWQTVTLLLDSILRYVAAI